MTSAYDTTHQYAVTWEDAAQEVTAFLGGDHWEAQCPQCRQLAADTRKAKDGRGARDYLAKVSQTLSAHPGPGAGQAEQAECDYDLYLAQRAAALGEYQLHWGIEWGPGHSPGPHPNTWQECPICTQWVKDRRDAREHLRRHGADDARELGPSDNPTW